MSFLSEMMTASQALMKIVDADKQTSRVAYFAVEVVNAGNPQN